MSQEIYVKEMPKSCLGCKFFAQDRRQCEIELGFEWSEKKFKFNDCPLIDIKTHDRELVKEVCEKIRKEIESQTDVRIAVNNFNTITGHGLEYVFRRIQKEIEK